MPGTSAPPDSDSVALLGRLYREELLRRSSDVAHVDPAPWNEYLEAHAQPNSVLRTAQAFERYLPHVPRKGRMLDWGCFHAPDACLVRNALGDAVELHGCDYPPPGTFAAFHEFAGLNYAQLEGPGALPWPDDHFDVVIASGVLEHVPNDSEALKELHRILREGGLLVVTFLPNRLSYTELAHRRLNWAPHARRYGLSEARKLGLHHGFEPIAASYHQMIPAQQGSKVFERLWRFNSLLERAAPLNRLSTNIMLICRRRKMF